MSTIKHRNSVAQRAAPLVPFLALSLAHNTVYSQDSAAWGVLEEVIVTAQKREQRLQDVPVSLQSFSGDFLNSVNSRDLTTVINFVPGAAENTSTSSTIRQYQIRGLYSGQGQGGGDSTVSYYLNDAATSVYKWNAAPVSRVFDVQRTEILRGPQGTLYGNGSMGGTIRFITNKPNLENYEVHLRAGYSEPEDGDNGYYFDGAASIPLIQDTLGLRVAASDERIGGYMTDITGADDEFGQADIKSYRAELLWRASETLDLTLLYNYQEGEQDGGSLMASLDPPISASTVGDYNNDEQSIYNLTIDWDLGFATLTNSSTLFEIESEALLTTVLPPPLDLVFGPTLEFSFDFDDGESVNNELRLVSNSDGPLQWITGFYYNDSSMTIDLDSNIQAIIPEQATEFNSEAWSVFGEVSYELLDGKLIPLFGVRYFEDDRDALGSDVPEGLEDTFDSTNPRFNLSWFPTEEYHFFLNIAKGFRSGDFNGPAFCTAHIALAGTPCELSIDSDELWSYELGTKLDLMEGQLLLEASAYFLDWQDIRQSINIASVGATYQVGDGEITGMDVSLTYAPAAIEGLRFVVSGNVLDTEWTEIDPALSEFTGAMEGDELPFAPEYTFSFQGSYNFPLSGDWSGLVATSFNYIDGQLGAVGEDVEGDSRQLMTARIGAQNSNFGVYLFGNNLLEEDGAVFAQEPEGSLPVFTQDYPRQIGIEVTYDFN